MQKLNNQEQYRKDISRIDKDHIAAIFMTLCGMNGVVDEESYYKLIYDFHYKDSNVDTLFKQQAKQAVDKAYPEIYAKYLQRQESESDTSRG